LTYGSPIVRFFRKRGLGPDQSQYYQSRLWSRLHTTLAQITRITPKWRYTEYTVLKIFHRSGFSSNLHLPWKTEFALKIFIVLNIFLSFRSFEQLALALKNRLCSEFTALNIYFFYHSGFLSGWRLPWKTEFALKFFTVLSILFIIQDFEQLALALKNRVCFKFTVLNIGYVFYHSGFLNNLLLPWKQSLPWNFSERGGCCPPASYACDHRVCELPMAFLFQNIRKRFYCTSFSAHNL